MTTAENLTGAVHHRMRVRKGTNGRGEKAYFVCVTWRLPCGRLVTTEDAGWPVRKLAHAEAGRIAAAYQAPAGLPF